MVCYSAVSTNEDYSFMHQAVGVAIGIILMLICWRFDYKYFSEAVIPLLIINVVFIMSPHIPGLGVSVKGANS